MIQFSVHSFWCAMQLLEQEAGTCAMAAVKDPHAVFPESWDERFTVNLTYLAHKCDEIQSDVGRNMARRISQMARDRMPLQVINNNLHALKGVLEDEVKVRVFCYIPQTARAVLLETQQRWPPVWDRFKSTRDDTERAAECYALGLYAACIFHMMMVLERGIASLASALKVKRGQKAWGNLLDDIQAAIAKQTAGTRSTPKGAKPLTPVQARKRMEFLAFCAEAAKEFTYFKDAWRNHVSHGRAHYEESDAIKVMNHVRDFMLHISTRLKEVK